MAIVFSAKVSGNLAGGAEGLWTRDNYLTGEFRPSRGAHCSFI